MTKLKFNSIETIISDAKKGKMYILVDDENRENEGDLVFSANDVIVNTGVLLSGVLVYLFRTNIPDLVIGGVVSVIVIRGGLTIIRLSKRQV